MLQLKNVSKKYNARPVLHIPSLEIPPGIYWIKGANGSGKTTMLKIIAGLLPFEGDITCNNYSLKKQPLAYRQQISWAEAEPLFPSFIRGNELIRLYADIRKVRLSETNELISLLDMGHYIQDQVETYSAGMLKKLSLLLAFIGSASLIALDEPLITLDTTALEALAGYILDRHKTKGTTFLMSSHQDPGTILANRGKEIMVANQTVSLV